MQTSAAASASVVPLRETLDGDGTSALDACIERLVSLGVEADDAELFVARAFGWGKKSQAFWRGEKVNEVPDPATVDAALQYVRELGIATDSELLAVVQAFPEVIGCDVQDQLDAAVNWLATKCFIPRGKFMVKTIKRKPEVLGYNIDCEGTCVGECNRCWVRM